jgi:hypothetical protein
MVTNSTMNLKNLTRKDLILPLYLISIADKMNFEEV